MRVAVAGATGVLGRAALPALAAAGHEVRGFARSAAAGSEELVAVDLLDRDAVVGFAREWRPEALVQLVGGDEGAAATEDQQEDQVVKSAHQATGAGI